MLSNVRDVADLEDDGQGSVIDDDPDPEEVNSELRDAKREEKHQQQEEQQVAGFSDLESEEIDTRIGEGPVSGNENNHRSPISSNDCPEAEDTVDRTPPDEGGGMLLQDATGLPLLADADDMKDAGRQPSMDETGSTTEDDVIIDDYVEVNLPCSVM